MCLDATEPVLHFWIIVCIETGMVSQYVVLQPKLFMSTLRTASDYNASLLLTIQAVPHTRFVTYLSCDIVVLWLSSN